MTAVLVRKQQRMMLLLSVCAVCTVLVRPTTGTVVLPVDVYRGTRKQQRIRVQLHCFCCSVDLARLHKLTTKAQTDNKSNHAAMHSARQEYSRTVHLR